MTNVKNHINHLENALDRKLFIQQKRMLIPTSEAKEIFHKTYSHYERLENEFSGLEFDSSENERISILTSSGASMIWVLDAISKTRPCLDHHRIHIYISEEMDPDISNKYDIIAWPHSITSTNYKLVGKTIFETQLYASQKYIDEMGMPLKPEDLDHHKIIAFYHSQSNKRGDPDWALRLGRKPAHHRSPSMVVNSATGIAKAILNDLGIGILTTNSPFKNMPGIVPVLPEISNFSGNMYFFYNIDSINKKGVESFLGLIDLEKKQKSKGEKS